MTKNWLQNDITADTPHNVLGEVFGHREFRGNQKEVVDASLEGKDVLYIAPTGMGKSLCYQMPAVMTSSERTTLVVSPLIALMRDQIGALKELGIPAIDVHHQSQRNRENLMQGIADREFALVYSSPEQLTRPDMLDALKSAGVARMVVDEAHCVSQWGHDFRPDYARLGQMRRTLSAAVSAFTATASPTVEEDIRSMLALTEDAYCMREKSLRENLSYGVTPIESRADKMRRLVTLIREHAPGPDDGVIIYSGTKAETDRIAFLLRKEGIDAQFYHGEMGMRMRKDVEEKFIQDDPRVLVATNAFGMGIDKPNVRLIVHYHFPGSVQAYLQETGRAGRDDRPAHCHLLYDKEDVGLQEYFIEKKTPDVLTIRGVYRVLEAMTKNAPGYDGFKNVNMFAFYRRFDRKVKTKGIYTEETREIEVNSALSILEHVGAITRFAGSSFALNGYDDAMHEVVRDVRGVREHVTRACLAQMIDFAEHQEPNQQMLIRMLEKDLRGNGTATPQ